MNQNVVTYLEKNREKFMTELKNWLKIPSISADSKYDKDTNRAADFIAEDLKRSGFKTEIVKTPGHPIVYAEWLNAPGKPTILIYGHYDVQPVDPISEWKNPPFDPVEKNGLLYARGASDDKGQCFTHVKAVEAWLKTEGKLPVNVKFLIEGEEESGHGNLEPYIEKNPKKLACDYVVVSDSGQFAPGLPAITYGLRGIVTFEVVLRGPTQDLHSGGFGGAVANPGNALASIIAAFHDKDRKVQIPGFYDDVAPLAEWERKQYASLPFNEKSFLEQIGINAGCGEKGYTSIERKWARPTLDINGITCGYQGEGSKTIIPATASAKFSCRLVPNMNPDKIKSAVEKFIQERTLPGIQAQFLPSHGAPAVIVPAESNGIKAAVNAIEKAFGKKPVFTREGGSIPIVASFKKELGADTLLLGWGQNDDNVHSPNEKFCIDDFYKGIRASAELLGECAVHLK